MEIDFKTCTIEELWKYISLNLEKKGFDVVLVGGAVVSIYSRGMYVSGDLDFIVRSFNKKQLPKVLAELGFIKTPQRYFKHPECDHLYLEFPTGPIEIAGNYDVVPDEVPFEKEMIKILAPTDCVLDRLEQFFICEYGKPHGERKLLEQAMLVAERQVIDLGKVERYCVKNGMSQIYMEIKKVAKK